MGAQRSIGQAVIAFVERYCIIPDGEHVGRPMRLAPFQKKFIRAVYDNKAGTRRAYLSIARKNGKTGLIAALVLAHLVGPRAVTNSQIISGARSRDQAALVFDLAAKMVHLSPDLSKLVRVVPSGKRLIGLPLNVEYRAIAADGTTAHGLSPVLAILDEVGQVRGPRDDFIDAITTSQGAHREPLLIAISTQAPTDADLFSIWLDDAARSKDPRIVSHVYAAAADADLQDRKAWKAANPALGIFRSLEDVREQAAQAERMPGAENTYRNLTLNQRVNVNSPFISQKVWEGCAKPVDAALFRRAPVFLGLDLSARNDLTALAMVARDDAGIWHCRVEFFAPEVGVRDRSDRDRAPYDVWASQELLTLTPGASVDYDFVASRVGEILSDCDVQVFAFDRWRMDVFKAALQRAGLELASVADGGILQEFGQGFRDMSPAMDTVEAELLNQRIRHGGHPILKWCAANAIAVKDPAGNRKLDKSKSTGRIDGLVALTMALGVAATAEDVGESVYEQLARAA